MMRPLLPLLVILSIASHRACAGDPPRNGPVRFEGQITDQDSRVKFQLEAKSREMRARPYDVPLAAGKRYTITLDAAEPAKGFDPKRLDPFLVVQDAEGKTLAHDDDSGGNRNARLTLVAPRDGTYRVYAAASRGTGAFNTRPSKDKAVNGDAAQS